MIDVLRQLGMKIWYTSQKRNTPICTRNTTVSIRRIEERIKAKGIDFKTYNTTYF